MNIITLLAVRRTADCKNGGSEKTGNWQCHVLVHKYSLAKFLKPFQ